MSIDLFSPTTNEELGSYQPAALDPLPLDGLVAVPIGQKAPSVRSRAFGSVLWSLVGVAVAGLVWSVGSANVEGLPSPTETFRSLGTLLANAFVDNGPNDQGIGLRLFTSLKRVFGGFAIASIVGVPFGLWMGTSKRVWRASNPVVQLLRPVSPLVWFPIWLVVFKDSGQAALWVIFVTALWPIVLNTAVGAGSIPLDQRNVAKVFRFNRRTYVRHIVLPNSLPSIVTGMRLSMGVAWMVIVAVEMMSAGSGIGTYTWDSYNAGAMDKVLSALLVIGAVGLLLDLFFLRLTKAVALKESRP